MNIKIFDEETIKLNAREEAIKEVNDLINKGIIKEGNKEDEIEHRTKIKVNKRMRILLDNRIKDEINTRFGVSFLENFALGGVKAGMKQFLAELGLK